MPETVFIVFFAIFLTERPNELPITVEPIATAADAAAIPMEIALTVELFIFSPSYSFVLLAFAKTERKFTLSLLFFRKCVKIAFNKISEMKKWRSIL